MLTRGEFFRAAGAGAAGALALGGAIDAALASAASSPSSQSFRSRPDLRPPATRLLYAPGVTPSGSEGYFFVGPTAKPQAQAGVLIVDANGQAVWFDPAPPGSWVSNFQVQQYQGQPVLTWWQGVVRPPGYGWGEGVILDSSYQEIARVRARGGRRADLHEFRLTPRGTALITCHPQTLRADLSGVGGPADGRVLESIIQEIDVASGRLLFEWRSLEHVGIGESYLPPAGLYDYLHVNSIDLTPDGDLLVSGRHTSALYKVHRHSGKVLWRLGGRRSDFSIAAGARFHWQHDARHLPGSQISVFDNGAGPIRSESQSRGLVLQVADGRVHLAQAYRHRPRLQTAAMGSVQTLPGGNVIVGWGQVPVLSEFTSAGDLLADLHIPWGYNSYRGFRLPWSGTPTDQPAIACASGPSSGTTTVYASWNGATAVSSWQVSAGPSAGELQPIAVAPRSGFETAIQITASQGYVAATALDANGDPLGSSAPLVLSGAIENAARDVSSERPRAARSPSPMSR